MPNQIHAIHCGLLRSWRRCLMSGRGREMHMFSIAVSVSFLLLVLAIIAYFTVDTVVTTNRNLSDGKQKVIEEAVLGLKETGSAFIVSNFSTELLEIFNQDLINKLLTGDVSEIYRYATKVILLFYPVDFVGFVSGDGYLAYAAQPGIDVKPVDLPIPTESQEYVTLDHLGDRSGFFISVFFPVQSPIPGFGGGGIRTNMIVDRTEKMSYLEEYYRDQRNGNLLRIGIAAVLAVILSLLLTTFGLRYLTHKYVAGPIEELNRQAREIMEGTFEGEVKVDEGSAYAALQGLLRSGQKVLQRMERELDGP